MNAPDTTPAPTPYWRDGRVTDPEKYGEWIKKQADTCGASPELRAAVRESVAAPWTPRKGEIVTKDGRQGMIMRKLSAMCGAGKYRVQTTHQRTSQDWATGKLTEYTASVEETWEAGDMEPEHADT